MKGRAESELFVSALLTDCQTRLERLIDKANRYYRPTITKDIMGDLQLIERMLSAISDRTRAGRLDIERIMRETKRK
jgi:hypothetical protein